MRLRSRPAFSWTVLLSALSIAMAGLLFSCSAADARLDTLDKALSKIERSLSRPGTANADALQRDFDDFAQKVHALDAGTLSAMSPAQRARLEGIITRASELRSRLLLVLFGTTQDSALKTSAAATLAQSAPEDPALLLGRFDSELAAYDTAIKSGNNSAAVGILLQADAVKILGLESKPETDAAQKQSARDLLSRYAVLSAEARKAASSAEPGSPGR